MQEVIAKSDRGKIVLVEIRSFLQGCVLEINAVARRGDMSDQQWSSQSNKIGSALLGDYPSEELPAELLRIGVQLRDGRKVTSLTQNLSSVEEEDRSKSPNLLLVPMRGHVASAGDTLFQINEHLWMQPLPPAEPFDLVVEWPTVGIPVTRRSIDGARIVNAAQQATPFWDN
ncbi:hypothetical protein GCM10012275_39320 [Longimycelium tulufanense]|uniref:Uncharacterized protein n=1 Tax=Longimycelium tulufanense TaxID=907463 RepID=A0A8J3CAH4_9PSEU|nr:hypothetical protein GCM10012275_39320 [Longimycelium tulufanense]